MATSGKGAIGLMQLMPATGKSLAKELGIHLRNKKHLYNPQLNVILGVRYLNKLSNRFSDMNLVLAAYNMGPNKLRRQKKKNPNHLYKYTRLVYSAHDSINQL